MIDYNNLGTGADGDVVYASDHTLTADLNANTLWVKNGATLKTNGYRIFCRGTAQIDGPIKNDGGDAVFTGGGADTSPGTLPIFPLSSDIFRSEADLAWGDGGVGAPDGTGDGSPGNDGHVGGGSYNALPAATFFYNPGPPAAVSSIPGHPAGGGTGAGGTGGSSVSLSLDTFANSVPPSHSAAGGGGGVRAANSTIAYAPSFDFETLLNDAYSSPSSLNVYGLPSACGSVGGGGGGGSCAYGVGIGGHGGKGGGRGGHGGWVVLFAKDIVINEPTGSGGGGISSRGGAGGQGTSGGNAGVFGGHAGGGAAGGGGTGGNGGGIIVGCNTLAINGLGGIAADGGLPGLAGPSGGAGSDTLSPTGSSNLNNTPTPAKDGASGGSGFVLVRALSMNVVVIGHGVNCNDYAVPGVVLPAVPAPGNGSLIADLGPMNSWCRANGISAALTQDSQRSAKDMIDELLTLGNSAPVYSGDKLKIIPYDEVSNAGYGSIYVSPTAAGPIANLADQDYVSDGKTPPVKFTRKRRTDCDNVVAIEYVERSLDYAHNVVSELDQKAIALYGPRKGGTLSSAELGMNVPSGAKSLMCISNKTAAQAIASILAKRSAAGVNQYSFTLKSEWMHLEAMDLVQISDSRLGLVNKAARLVSVKETAKRTYECLADEFTYGLNHPSAKVVTPATGSLVKSNIYPGLVNAPIIFQPPASMLPPGSSPQIWILVSGADPNYGGCVAYVSIDGGVSYPDVLGAIAPATTGVLTADYPLHTDPDTTDTLAVDLSESNGSLSTQSTAIADSFADPCFVAGGSGFEAVCPTVATLTSAEHYSLGTYIRRAVLGTLAMIHPTTSRFAVMDGAAFKINLPPQWVGLTLYFKFAAYNKTHSQQNNLADCVPYTFTPEGSFAPGGFYVNGS